MRWIIKKSYSTKINSKRYRSLLQIHFTINRDIKMLAYLNTALIIKLKQIKNI